MAFDQPPAGFFDEREEPLEPANDDVFREPLPPHDLVAEAAVISAEMLDPLAFDKVSALVRPEDFYSGAHLYIQEAIVGLNAESKPIDVALVGGVLRDRDRLAQVGGMAGLTELLNAAPAVGNVVAYAERVAEKSRARKALAQFRDAEARIVAGGEPRAIVASVREELATLESDSLGPTPVSLTERARSLRARCPVVRLATGLPTLDKICRGGLRVGTFMIIGGAPGVGKTALVVDQAHRWARAGIPVDFLAADEGPDDILMRLALHEGIDAALLEKGDLAAWDELEERLADLPLALFDGDDGHTLEAVAEHLATVAGTGPSVLVGDSVQTIMPAGPLLDADASPRARVDLVLRAAKKIARSGPLVVLTSELGRGAYKNRANADNVTPLAAFKESGGIEYGAQTALVLRSVPDGEGRVEVDVPKNRGGFKESFSLEVDSRTRVREVDAPGVETEAKASTKARSRKAEHVTAAARVAEYLARHQGDGSRDIRSGLRVALGACTSNLADDAVKILQEAGAIVSPDVARGQSKPHYLDGSKVPPDVLGEVQLDRRGEVVSARPTPPEAP